MPCLCAPFAAAAIRNANTPKSGIYVSKRNDVVTDIPPISRIAGEREYEELCVVGGSDNGRGVRAGAHATCARDFH
jgi:hypothetical protein